MKLEGKTAVITGAAKGIGRATALMLAAEGAAVAVSDIARDEVNETAELVRKAGGKASAFFVDVRDNTVVKQMFDKTAEKFGNVDILVNNAGGLAGWLGDKSTLFADASISTWEFVLDVNLMGVFRCTAAALPYMLKSGYGKIINVASIAGVTGIRNFVDYSAAKGGVIAMTKALAMEVGEHNINVNCVSPGAVATHNRLPRGTYLGPEDNRRNGTPEDIASLITYLASPDSDYITGQNYIIDGGRTLGPKN